jgi:Rrf2 family iron-sulfur cluster assembly transcriptional regulator
VTNCQGKGNCHHGETCLTHHLWEDLSGQIHEFLSQISLGDLMERRTRRAVPNSMDGVLQTLSLR